MPVSGLLLTLDSNPARADAVLRAIGNDQHIELGVRDGRKQAAVIDASDERENRRLWTWLDNLPGVEHIDVVFISIDTDDERSRSDHLPLRQTMQEGVR